MRPKMMVVGAICLVSAAAFAACQPSQPVDAAAKSEPLKLEAPAPKAAPATAAPKKTVAKADATPAVSKAVATNTATTPAIESRAVDTKQNDEDAPIATTVTGCLEWRDDGMFQLKDADGQHAPKARSWKSGFIKKGSAKIDVLDAGNRLALNTHVGHRVSISGTLADRELRARSLRATNESCK